MRIYRRAVSLGLPGLALVSLLAGRIAHAETGKQETMVVGFTAAHFADINRSDAVAAIKVWIDSLIDARGFNVGAKTIVYDDMESLSEALREGTPDLMILLTSEYLSVLDEDLLDPEFISVCGQEMGETYVLAVNRDSGFRSLEDLRGRRLVVKEGARMSLAEAWIDRALADAGLPEAGVLFENVTHEKSVSRTVLPVFFRKADACLVTRNSFEMMCELNPQIRNRLEPLATSACLVPSITCMRAGYNSTYRPEIVEALGDLHKEPKGEQILSLFRVDRLVPFEPRFIDSAIDLLTTDDVLKLSEAMHESADGPLRSGVVANRVGRRPEN